MHPRLPNFTQNGGLFRISCLVLCCLVWCGLAAKAQTEKEGVQRTPEIPKRDTQGLSIKFVSEVTSVEPGKPFKVGLLIKHDPNYHTYWKNPGVVGVPTSIDLSVPQGFKVSEMYWPSPEQSMMAVYPCYGYERDILIFKIITPPAKLREKTIKIANESAWMCCAKTCSPGFKKFALELPVGKHVIDDELKKDFKGALDSIPKSTTKIKASLQSKPDAKQIKLRITSPEKRTLVHVFNSDGQTSPDLKYNLVQQSPSVWIYTAERSEYGPQSATSFPFVLQTSQGFFELTAK